MTKVDSLKKIEILLESGTTSNKMDLTSQPVKKTFIFGIDSEGLTPFECELANKLPGDEVSVNVYIKKISAGLYTDCFPGVLWMRLSSNYPVRTNR
ncbi:MAG: hypothetical protein JRJ65_16305 [Deltaproteobacteria bacterium]|nr:hypothetical protein [Deltaproteobacteria bacterium]